MELIKNSKDKRARKLAKKRVRIYDRDHTKYSGDLVLWTRSSRSSILNNLRSVKYLLRKEHDYSMKSNSDRCVT
ncbi:hypothetical protein BGZ58_006925, partial [Dissophora ornata]